MSSKPNLGPNKQRNPYSALLFPLLTLISLAAAAAPPANDNCSSAWVIPNSGPFPYLAPAFEITAATSTGDPTTPPLCQPYVTRSIWYRFTPSNTEFYTFSTCPDETTVADTVIAVYTNPTGCSDASLFSLVACADDSSGGCLTKATLTTALHSNYVYYIVVWQYSRSQITAGNAYVKMVVSKTLPPANDTCPNAQLLTLNMPVFGSTLAANDNYETSYDVYAGLSQTPSSSSGRDVVYTFIAPDTDTYSVKVYDYSSDPNDLVLYATSDCPEADPTYTFDTVIAAANRGGGLGASAEELFCMPLQAGQQIYIFVDEQCLECADEKISPGSTFRIEVNRCRLEQDGNTSPDTASPLGCGVEGSIYSGNEPNYFALGTFAAGSRAFALIDSSATTPTYFALQIQTNTTVSTNFIQFATGNNDDRFGSEAANIGGTILPPVPTFLKAFKGVSAKEPFRLYAVVQPPIEMATWESEPNNSYEAANSATNDYNYFRGTLPTSSDVDVFRFTAMGGDLIFASLDCDPLRDMTPIRGRLELLDGDGKSLLGVEATDSISETNIVKEQSPRSPSTGFVYRVADEGEFDFFIRVSISPSAIGPPASGDYLLSISKNCFAGARGVNTAPLLSDLNLPASVGGDTAMLNGSIIDPDTGESFTIAVDWGDGSDPETITPGAGVYSFAIPHVYMDSGNYPVSLTVKDNNGGSIASNIVAAVTHAAPTVTLQVTPAAIFENNSVTLNGTISNPGLQDTHTVLINWGDGSINSTLNLAVGETTFTANHLYLDDNPTGTPWDTCSINVTVTDNSGASGSASVPLVISNVPPVLTAATLTSSIMPNQSAGLTASFTDAGPLDTFTFEVNWGDGTPVQRQSAISPLSLSHVYSLANTNLNVNLTVWDDDGGSVSTNLPIAIQMPVKPQLTLNRTNGVLWLYLQGTPGATYRLQGSTNLPSWFEFGTVTPPGNGHIGMSLTNSASRFFRAVYP